MTATAITLDRQAAADVVQDALLAAHRSWDTVRDLERPDLWLRRVVVNGAIDHRRSQRRRWRVLERGGPDPGLVAHLGDTVGFWVAVGKLAPRQQQVIVLRAVDELSVAEIAQALDLAQGTVKATLHQARARLRELLRIDDGTPETEERTPHGRA